MKLPNFQSLTTFAWFFVFFGVLFGGISLLLMAHKLNFLRQAVATQGEVIAVDPQTDDEDSLSAIKIRFIDQSGARQVFSPRLRSNPPRYQVGQVVNMYYDPTDPAHGEVDDFIDMWLFESVFGGIGLAALIIGVIILIKDYNKKKQRDWLLNFGIKIKAEFDSIVEANIVVNGKAPNLIVCQYLDPKTNQLFLYRSDYIWFNPTPHLPKSGKLDVWIDPENPAKYWVDVSFLPKQVN